MHRKLRLLVLPLFVAAAIVLSACGTTAAAPNATPVAAVPTTAPATAAPATVVPTGAPTVAPTTPPTATAAAEPTLPPSADPVTYIMPGTDYGYPSPFTFYPRGPGYLRMAYLFDTLVWKDDAGYVPWLAETWALADDGVTWTFAIRQGVTWHDGQPFTAADVVFTFDYMKQAMDNGMIKWGWPLDRVASAVASDDGSTVTVTVTEPTAGLLTDLFGSLPMLPKHIWETVADPVTKTDAEAVIGTGMFRLDSYSKEEGRYVYTANEDFFLGKPTVDTLVYITVKDSALSLLAGEVDEASFSGKGITSVAELRKSGDFEIVEGPSDWVLKLYINTTRAPFDQLAVRQALAYAISREEIVAKAQMGGAIVASTGLLSPGTYWHNADLPAYDYDVEQAQALLDEAGVAPFSTTLVTTESYAREAELIQGYLAAIGITVTIQSGDTTTVDGLLGAADFDLLITGHGGTANPDLESPAPAGAWTSEEYQRAYELSRSTVDDEERLPYVLEMQRIIAEQLPVLALWHPMMWEVYTPGHATPFYTPEGVDGGIPTATNKLMFIARQ